MNPTRRRLLVSVGALILGCVALPGLAAEGDFIITGGGWGHGVGMSQYGAHAMALDEDVTDGDILGYYYSGAMVTPATGLGLPAWLFEDEALAINVASKRTNLSFGARGDLLSVCQQGDGTDDCLEPDVLVEPLQILRVEGDGTVCTRSVFDSSGALIDESEVEGACVFDLNWQDLTQPIPPQVTVEGLTYARGPMEIRPSTVMAGFDVVVRLGVEEYLFGIAEMPFSWPVEALKAQAITARSFGLATAAARGGADGTGRLADCGCHLRRTTADQAYLGWAGAEGTGSSGQRWKNDAVEATDGEVLTHPEVGNGSQIITTYYSSSTGGATENNEDVFGGPALAHLRSVPDPFSVDSRINNPFATWESGVARSAVEARLGWDAVISMELVTGPPGSMIEVRGVDNGVSTTQTWTGWEVREQFDLRSPYITGIAVEGPPPPPFTDIFGSVHAMDIGFIWREGITRGCNPPDNTLYCPDRAVSREEMATFLVRALGLPGTSVDTFVDDDASVHEHAIDALAAAGVTRGCNPPDNDRFCPERTLSRGEMAAFLVRAFDYPTPDEVAGRFGDDDGSTFEAEIAALAAAGVTKGCNPPANDEFCPEDPVTRAQMASFLARALGGG